MAKGGGISWKAVGKVCLFWVITISILLLISMQPVAFFLSALIVGSIGVSLLLYEAFLRDERYK